MNQARWLAAREKELLPVRYFHGVLTLPDELNPLALVNKIVALGLASAFQQLMDQLYAKKWVTYCKAPFGGPEQGLRYPARYTHRVAISNHRLIKLLILNHINEIRWWFFFVLK